MWFLLTAVNNRFWSAWRELCLDSSSNWIYFRISRILSCRSTFCEYLWKICHFCLRGISLSSSAVQVLCSNLYYFWGHNWWRKFLGGEKETRVQSASYNCRRREEPDARREMRKWQPRTVNTFKDEVGHLKCSFSNLAFEQCLTFGNMNISLTNLPCLGYIRETCGAYISQLNFVSVMFYMSSKTTWTSCILNPGSAQAWAGSSTPCWPLKWRKQKLLLLPPCLHFCPYFLKYMLHQCLCPTSPETIVCKKLCGFVCFDCLCQGI